METRGGVNVFGSQHLAATAVAVLSRSSYGGTNIARSANVSVCIPLVLLVPVVSARHGCGSDAISNGSANMGLLGVADAWKPEGSPEQQKTKSVVRLRAKDVRVRQSGGGVDSFQQNRQKSKLTTAHTHANEESGRREKEGNGQAALETRTRPLIRLLGATTYGCRLAVSRQLLGLKAGT
jgi:hypothetical protein